MSAPAAVRSPWWNVTYAVIAVTYVVVFVGMWRWGWPGWLGAAYLVGALLLSGADLLVHAERRSA